MREAEQIHQVADGGLIKGHVGIPDGGFRIREVVAAAIGDRRQFPIGFDELQYRNVIGVSMGDVTWFGET